MTHTAEVERVQVAHDGDFYYLVEESALDLAHELASKVMNGKTHLGRYLAGRQLRNLVECEIDLAVDDTGPEYNQANGLTREELSLEVLKVTSVA